MLNGNSKLTISRVIQAPRSIVWKAWSEKEHFEQWWIPEPIKCKVVKMDMTPGGAFETLMSENGEDFQPHVEGCFLDIVPEKRIIFTTVLTEGWKPIDPWLAMTAIITMEDADKGTKYTAQALHKNPEDSNKHLEMGFEEGWGTTIDQLEKLTMKLA
ncbi:MULTISPECIES: SRPBCC family protein [Marinobacter]|uniref:SRPBCC family protein n=1 Tax=Marinobacter TaxID=2742 RepID=UPI001245DB81|nr:MULTISPECIES: SRPBCC family protein [Marinobacter]MBL3559090.1 SRPBCC family protein [Marinobacter sp. JB05H06]